MTNVIKLNRKEEDLKETVIAHIKDNDKTRQMFFAFPSEEDKDSQVFWYTNFQPGVQELLALNFIRDYLADRVYDVQEEEE